MVDSRPITPEWLTPARADFALDDALKGGWGVSPAPVSRGASFTDFGTHEIAVPYEDSPEARAIQFHELLHTRFSPTNVPVELMSMMNLSKQAVRVAEEVRINFLGRHLGAELPAALDTSIKSLADGTERAVTDRAVESKNWNDALSLFLSSYNTDAFRMVKRRLRRNHDWREPLEVVEQEMERWQYKVRADEWNGWSRTGSRGQTDPIEYRYRDRLGKDTTQYLPLGFVYHTMPLAEVIEQWFESPPQKQGRRRIQRIQRNIEKRRGNWEIMRFGSVSLTENTTSFISRRKRPSMTGKYPSRPDRLLTDPERRIFREVVRGRGGIVVFDCSGSMGVDHDVVRHAVSQFAGATVVVYSHNSHTGNPNTWIVAHNGRMISAEDFHALPLNSGNGVDGEVLRWAVRNRRDSKEFIVWVSDGAVTGRGDSTSEELLEEVSLLSARHNIIGVDTCEEALELLAEMKRGRVPKNQYCRLVTRKLRDLNKYGNESERRSY